MLFKNFWYSSRPIIFFKHFQYLLEYLQYLLFNILFAKKPNGFCQSLFPQKSSSYMFDRVLKFTSNVNKNLTCIFLNLDHRIQSQYAKTRNRKFYYPFYIETIENSAKMQKRRHECGKTWEKNCLIREVRFYHYLGFQILINTWSISKSVLNTPMNRGVLLAYSLKKSKWRFPGDWKHHLSSLTYLRMVAKFRFWY